MSTDSAITKATAARRTPLDYGTQLRLLQIELVKRTTRHDNRQGKS